MRVLEFVIYNITATVYALARFTWSSLDSLYTGLHKLNERFVDLKECDPRQNEINKTGHSIGAKVMTPYKGLR